MRLRWLNSCFLYDRSGNEQTRLGHKEYTLFTPTQTGVFTPLTQLPKTKSKYLMKTKVENVELHLLLNFLPTAQKLVCYRWHRGPGRWVRSLRCVAVCPQCMPTHASPAYAVRPHNPTHESVWQHLPIEDFNQYDWIYRKYSVKFHALLHLVRINLCETTCNLCECFSHLLAFFADG